MDLIQTVSKLQHMDDTIFRAAEAGAERVIPFLSPRSPATIGIVVGPEGGFAAEEAHVSETPGCQSASMGDLILRTETAGSYAVMLVRCHYGILNQGGA